MINPKVKFMVLPILRHATKGGSISFCTLKAASRPTQQVAIIGHSFCSLCSKTIEDIE